MLKALGMELRGTVDLTTIARFMHLLMGKKYTTLYNSDLYRKLQLVPELKGHKAHIKDLQHVKALFEQVELSAVGQLLEEAITTAQQARLIENFR